MTQSVTKNSTELQELASILLATLDESLFFGQLSSFLSKHVNADRTLVFNVLDDSSVRLVSENGRPVANGRILNKGVGAAGHVIRTKRPYFSNNVQRDPLFAEQTASDVKAELCIPVVHEGIVIATIHFQSLAEDNQFCRDDITAILSILGNLTVPLANMKMYLSAKMLNEALLKRIEKQQKEIEARKRGVQIADTYKVDEKEIIGKSEAMKKLLELADKVAATNVNILIEGEIGTGKEMVARRIHCRSKRAENAFVVVDCSTLNEQQLEAEIFGKEDYNFSGCSRMKSGFLEAANGGTLVLHRITSMPLALQAKLLYFLKEGMCFRVGGQAPYRVDARLITTTSSNLAEEVENGNFREDLFYHLNTMILKVPSLSARVEDIELLANYFLNHGRNIEDQKSFSPGAMKLLQDYSWPTNVRELQNIVERAYILADGKIVERNHLADKIVEMELREDEEEEISVFSEMTLNELEKKHICQTLDYLGGNKTKTARILGITVKTLYNKLHSYGMIDVKEAQ